MDQPAVPGDMAALERRTEELDALNSVATILNSAHDLRAVLELAIERMAAALHAEAGSLLVVDEATGQLVFEVALGPVADRLIGRRLAPGQGIAGWVAQTGKALLVPDVGADPRFSAGVDKASGFVTRTILCTPLQTGQSIIGVVQLLNRVDGRPFSQWDLQLLETISLLAAAIINHARVQEREKVSGVHVAMSKSGKEFNGALASLQGHLQELVTTASHKKPEMVPTIEEALKCLETLRTISRDLSGALPKDSKPNLPPTP